MNNLKNIAMKKTMTIEEAQELILQTRILNEVKTLLKEAVDLGAKKALEIMNKSCSESLMANGCLETMRAFGHPGIINIQNQN